MNAKTRLLIADHLAVPVGSVRDEAHLARDLGADSLDLVELSMRLEEALGILIADEESEACATVGDAMDLVERKLAGKKAARRTG
jgi:acyl carrier protein